MSEVTPSVTTPSQPAVGAPATTQPVGTQTATTAPAGAAPDFDWAKFDWESNADKVPWDKIDAKRIEQIPNVRKMQQSHERRVKELERQARQEREALQQQLSQIQQMIVGSNPEMAQQLQTVAQQADYYRDRQQLERYQEIEARRLIAQQYEIPEETVMSFQGGPDEVVAQALDYQRNHVVQQRDTFQKQIEEMRRQLDALTRQRTDPAANQDLAVATPAGNHYQTTWEQLVREGKGDEAEKIRREAVSKGLSLQYETIRPKGWA